MDSISFDYVQQKLRCEICKGSALNIINIDYFSFLDDSDEVDDKCLVTCQLCSRMIYNRSPYFMLIKDREIGKKYT